MLADWEEQIREAFLITADGNFEDQRFHDVIWEMSLTAFDIPRERHLYSLQDYTY